MSEPINCIYISSEDSIEHTIAPRLRAAGADMGRVAVVLHPHSGEPLLFPRDWLLLFEMVKGFDAKVVVFDPVFSCLEPDFSPDRDAEVRRNFMQPAAALAEQTGATLLVLRHVNKDKKQSARQRGGGSVGWRNAARAGLMFVREPYTSDYESRAIMFSSKGNLAPKEKQPALNYEIVSKFGVPGGDPEYGVPVVAWLGAVTTDLEAAVEPEQASGSKNVTKIDQCQMLIEAAVVESGGVIEDTRPLLTSLRDAGYSDDTINKARKRAGVVSESNGQPNNGKRWRREDGEACKTEPEQG